MTKITKLHIRKQKGGWKITLSQPGLTATASVGEGGIAEDLIEAMLGFRPRTSSQPPPPEPAPEKDV